MFFNRKIKELIMTLEDQVIALTASVATLQTSVTDIDTKVSALSIPAQEKVDLSGVLAAIADVKAQLEATPPAAAATAA